MLRWPAMGKRAEASSGYALLESELGACAVAWTPEGVTEVLLLDGVSELRAAMKRRHDALRERVPPAWVRRSMDRLRQHLNGEPQDLSTIPVVLDRATPFARRVYQALREIRSGQTITYGALARRVGSPGAARAVGQAMARNPVPLIVPCHRVVGESGRLGGFSARGGQRTKATLLRLEGAQLGGGLFDGSRPIPFDPTEARRALGRADPALARWMKRVGPCRLRLKPARSTLTALAEAIVFQQLTMKAGAAIFARLCASMPSGGSFTAVELLARTDTELRAAGLSRGKRLALRDLAARCQARQVPELGQLESMSDEAIVEALVAVRGVGRWTAEMLLIFQLGRPDVLPSSDYSLRKAFARVFGQVALPTPRELDAYGERWRPYRTVASWYLWRALE